MERISKQVNFVEEIEKLKKVTRFNRTMDGRFENSAEHSWQAAFVSSLFQEYYPKKLDMEKVMLMLLLHDLGEIYAGDTWVFDEKGKAFSHSNEEKSIEKSLGMLPTDQYQSMKKLWLEFETGDSAVAKYARVIDALVPLINHFIVSEDGYNPNNISSEMVLKKKKFIEEESPELWELTKELIQLSKKKGLYL
ncbi:MAG: HD domain-containing protein [Clostridiaceae bacterium]